MKELVFGLIAAAAVGGGVYYGSSSGGYAMSAKDARAKLMGANARIENGPFYSIDGMDVETTSPSENVVRWAASEGGYPRKTCEATIKPIAESEVEVTASCTSQMYAASGQGAVFAEAAQADINEFIDAALTGRAYNPKRKMEAATGSAMKNMGSMMGDAFETKRQVEAMEREYESKSVSNAGPETPSYDDEVIGEVESPAEYDDYETGAVE
jgi:hypothetical protein